ncbi:MAG: helix-turn-helix domain-containing protein [Chloroflexi bacterium]|nr:helix-turn-helix domain-containing protein [Chloroflexota bacterium]
MSEEGAYVNVGTAARMLGLHRETVVRWIRRGTLRGRRECARCSPSSLLALGCPGCRYYVFRAALRERLREADG